MAKREYTEEEKQLLREKYKDKIARLTFMDDEFMTRVFEDDLEATELILRIILGKKLTVISAKTQVSIANLRGRSVRLDIVAEDSDGKKYDIEIQRSDKGTGARRARFYSSLIDANALVKSEDFADLPESYVIFITENDVFGDGKPLYEIERTINESSKKLGDGSHIIYVNGANDNAETELGRLMHDFKCKNPQEMNYDLLKDRARKHKETEQEANKMGSVFDEVREEGRAEGRKEGIAETVKGFFGLNLSVEQIAKAARLSIENVLELQKEALATQ